jgi:hypothetical protein
MARTLLLRGMLVGFLAGLLAFGFAKFLGEPQVDRAIAFEAQMDAARGEPAEPELVSRHVQSTVGLLIGVVVYSTALGGLFSLVFAATIGRVGRIGPRELSALLALVAYIAIVVVPALKYPANPPSVGDPKTIRFRTGMFFLMLLLSLAAMYLSIRLSRYLLSQQGLWNSCLIGAGAFALAIIVAQSLMPDINEVPADFPAVVLWRFRIAALGLQAVIWISIGLLFGWLTERDLRYRQRLHAPT